MKFENSIQHKEMSLNPSNRIGKIQQQKNNIFNILHTPFFRRPNARQ